jgi:hypothetical protein
MLEHLVAPEIESDFVRGQVFAAIELLSQLQGRIEQRHDFVMQDVVNARETIRVLCKALEESGLRVPDEMAAVLPQDASDLSGLQLREVRERVESALSSVLDFFHEHRADLPDPDAIERLALRHIQQGIFRDLMLFRPQRFERISRSKRKENS